MEAGKLGYAWVVFTLVLALGLCSCSGNNNPSAPDDSDSNITGIDCPEGDDDSDGVCDDEDGCPQDADKSEPGDCGCGVPDDDADGDGLADCQDDCDTDPTNTCLNPCAPDVDSDGDGVCDWVDQCPGVDDTLDADGDGHPSCIDDCDDGDATTYDGAPELCDGVDNDCDAVTDEGAMTTFHADVDGDGYGDASSITGACAAPVGYVADNTDCNDSDASVHPGAAEVLCDTVDNDCDAGTTDDVDGDGDGYTLCVDDCDDAVAAVNPGVAEVNCDGVDNDCNAGTTDDVDVDGDGYTLCVDDCDDAVAAVNPGVAEVNCDGVDNDCNAGTTDDVDGDGDGYMLCVDDCDDTVAAVNPGAAEVNCDGVDNDCNAVTTDDVDGDGDGYMLCVDDCDDTVAAVNPGAAEVNCDGVDNDCDAGTTDDVDGDGDGYMLCVDDCDDTVAAVNPGAAEVNCDGVDNDCDAGTTDDVDGDGDGYMLCIDDCDDTVAAVNPGAAEILCDGVDNDCDAGTTDGADADGDSYSLCGGDCDDSDASVNPGAAEILCDGVDNDCDAGTTDDVDGDGDGYMFCVDDCDDTVAAVNPGVAEVLCDGVDNDCDAGTTDDVDGDGDGYMLCVDDCDDTVAAVNPGAAEVNCDGVDNDCNAGTTDDVDGDGDGYMLCVDDCNDTVAAVNPGAAEVNCDGVDNDCNAGTTDDVDGDGDGYMLCVDDCDDTVAAVNPGAAEVNCDGVDNDCNAGTTDDVDGDGDGYMLCVDDCDDTVAAVNPGAAEVNCDGVDNDCDAGTTDDVDGDGDGYMLCVDDCDDADFDVNPGVAEVNCDGVDNDCDAGTTDDVDGDGDGYMLCVDDCDDTVAAVNPGAAEVNCDGVDNDCDAGTTDDVDGDGDGYMLCVDDCDDTVAAVNPGAAEVNCDGVDNDCDAGTTDDVDGDGDGYMLCIDDCDDTVAAVNPGAAEILCDGVDNDCDAGTTDGADADGDSYSLCGGDCDDSDASVNPGAAEILCDGVDNDCDAGTTDDVDGDGDGYMFCVDDCDDTVFAVNPGAAEVLCDTVDNDCNAGTTDDVDGDGDGYMFCVDDCDDAVAAINPGAAEVNCDGVDNDCNAGTTDDVDGDGDGYMLCVDDCDDTIAAINPGAAEVNCDGVDNDCNAGTTDDVDGDGDGYMLCVDDCDDTVAAVNPGAAEVNCDGVDNDCNAGTTDDVDGDGDGYMLCVDDCDDAVAAVNPGAAEVNCDGVDNDCDAGTADDVDGDGDGYMLCVDDCDDADFDVNPGVAEVNCDGVDNDCDAGTTDDVDGDGDGYMLCVDDCDDTVAAVNPGAAEVNCDGVDNDCDAGTTDDVDGDGDGYMLCVDDCDDTAFDVNPGLAEVSCDGIDNDCDAGTTDDVDGDGDGYMLCVDDCDDTVFAVNPGAAEVNCDGVDNDCDAGTTDDVDGDGDGYMLCVDDCDDTVFAVNPGVAEVNCDGVDNDCNAGTTDDVDGDGDGYTLCVDDCDDTVFAINPGVAEVNCDGVDNDCDAGTTDDVDGDGDGYMLCIDDCDDTLAAVNPGAVEVTCDGLDNDCDVGTSDGPDGDGDGYSLCGGDCDDTDASVNPGAAEILCDGVDNDCDAGTTDDVDVDGDTHSVCSGDCDDGDGTIYPGAPDAVCDGVDNDCNGTADDGYTPVASACGVGECAATGMTTCESGSVVPNCTAGAPSSDDNCDNLDNDCNGTADDGYTPVASACGVGECAATGMTTCESGSVVPNCTAGAPSSDDNCDNLDNDCNGTADDGYTPVASACGVGECAATGMTTCESGSVVPNCTAGAPSSDDNCDNLDNDCNGTADDGYTPVASACGVGECAATGMTTCESGSVVPNCTAGAPSSDDNCDNLDNDCNGTADDGYTPVASACGVGECAATGMTTCESGSVVPNCTAGAPSSDDNCDNLDNDCNGTADDGYTPVASACGVGECAATGMTTCESGSVVPNCTAGAPSSDDNCDNLDNDCNGTADDGYTPVASACGVGECAATGMTTCESGSVVPNCTAGAPSSDDNCDNLDNDCNGTADDGYTPVASACGVGECAATGMTTCESGSVVPNCTAGAPSSDDNCDNLDNDCNGTADDGYTPVASACGVGECAATGMTTCESGSVVPNCTAGAPSSDDNCDNLDNDCNGTADDGYTPVASACGVGECAATGMTTCESGSVVPNCTAGAPSSDDNCDNLDNDCNGTADDGYTPVASACGVGECAATGMTTCESGSVVPNCTAGAPSSDDNCDNLDNDCNGTADDGYTPVASACGVGECAATGMTTCESGSVVPNCTAGAPSSDDNCDNLDNDCNGTADDGYTPVASACGVGECAATGMTTCESGSVVPNCTAGAPSSDDNCDNLDNDCNGTADDGYTPVASACGVGECAATGMTTCESGSVVPNCTAGAPSSDDNCDNLDNDCNGTADDGYTPVASACGVGECAATGMTTCESGSVVPNCTAGAPSSDDNCDNLDNDCNGTADDGYTPVASACGVGECAATGMTTCESGSVVPNCTAGAPSSDDNCDNLDNDCNGTADDGYTPVASACGVGECAATGMTTCESGSVVPNCTAGAPSSDDNCDNLDNDCNGTADDGYTPVASACGVGECAATGMTTCESGSVVPNCTAGAPSSDDNCDNLDNDCNGTADDGYTPVASACGVGECAATGMTTCESGSVVPNCTAGAPSSDDNCDNLDNDCNGTADDGYTPVASACGVGECAATGMTTCESGSVVPNCTAGAPSSDDNCDNLDNDCNGTADDGYTPVASACGVGECAATGMTTCESGSVVPNCTAGAPSSDDNCDNLDNDCNGTADDGYTPVASACGVGECAATGMTTCESGSVVPNCTAGAPSSDDNCDNLDNDCNGTADDGYTPVASACGVGECAATGMTTCESGSVVPNCTAGAPSSDDNCDNLDNDCNGTADDGYTPVASACGVGECAATGMTTCESGSVVPNCTAGAPSSDDNCDNLDNDCNGTADDGYTPVASACGVGECAATGMTTCESGSVVPNCTAGAPSSDDNCDNLDNDCNGTADDGYTPVASACGVGECAATGMTTCESGSVVPNCTAGAPSSDDNCDNLDNDCNGTADDGYTPVASACGVGECAATGMTTCESGSVVPNCTAGAPSSDDNCDNLDNDCNGTADDGYTPVASACGVGECAATGMTTCESGSVVPNCTAGAPAADDTVCDGLDNDCDGATDEDDATGAPIWYFDFDGDTYGDSGVFVRECTMPAGYVADNTDCHDGEAEMYPGNPEVCDGLDNNCDTVVPANEADGDSDGYMICEGDCDDGEVESFPGNPEIGCDAIDNDCSGATPDDFDADGDGVTCSTDSDDANPNVCSDDDTDGCNDCSSGSYDPDNDGGDYDGDGQCNAGDPDDDNDGVNDGPDSNPFNQNVCSDNDLDSCDDCSLGSFNPANDGPDGDGDGVCDAGDVCPGFPETPDTDGDGVPDGCDQCWGNDATGDYDSDGTCDDLDPPPAPDCVGAGTVEDATYQLCWQDNYSAIADVASGQAYCDSLTLGGYTDWSMPTIDQLRAVIEGCPDSEPGGACGVTDPTCLTPGPCDAAGCWGCGNGSWLTGGMSGHSTGWEMSISPAGAGNYWGIRPSNAWIWTQSESSPEMFVRCVRDLAPACPDADGDTVCDVDDVCPAGDDSIDTDGDWNPDCNDICPNDPQDDFDGDGLCGDVDPCPTNLDNTCTMIEDFESGAAWPWGQWVESGVNAFVDVNGDLPHDGYESLTYSGKFAYRTDTTFGLVQDEVLRAWCNTGLDANTKCAIGFGSDATGTYTLQIESFFDKVKIMHDDYGDIATDAQTIVDEIYVDIQTDTWYMLEVHVRPGGVFDGQVYEADGVTPVASVQANFGALAVTGVAARASGDARIDTITSYDGTGACIDIDGDGSCDADDLCEGNDATGDDDADGICNDIDLCWGLDMLGDTSPADGFCDEAPPDPTVPPFYDQAATEEEWAAGGICAEKHGGGGLPACTQAEWQQYVDDQAWILANYPYTNAVYDAATGGGQTYAEATDMIICSGFDADPNNYHMFDDLNAMYYGTGRNVMGGSFVFNEFQWGVNVWYLESKYNTRAQQFGGICAIDALMGGSPTGFHAVDIGSGWTRWTVQSTEDCDIDGCRCDATLVVDTHPTLGRQEWSETNDSVAPPMPGLGSPPTHCTDPRFGGWGGVPVI